jgi:polyhydroxyalkanoate synthase subunit PhaC
MTPPPFTTNAANMIGPLDVPKAFSMMEEFTTRWVRQAGTFEPPRSFSEAWRLWVEAVSQEPVKAAALQAKWVAENKRLLSVVAPGKQDSGASAAETPRLSLSDKRFASEAWQTNPAFLGLAESYLGMSRVLLESLEELDLSDDARLRLRFFFKQYLDAIAPTNFLLTNPEAMKLAIETQGASLRNGLENLKADMDKGHISMTDEAAFAVGKNIALTPGSVVFENEIFQLLQYSPQTKEVRLRPLLMVPPCINKFYILDLRPDNSLIEYAVRQGFTVFVMSWRNVKAPQAALTWDDYLRDGVIRAIDIVRCITNVHKINTLGFCVGGTMLACALAVLRRMGHDVVESVTFLTTFLDFSDVGDINAYVDSAFVERREREVGDPARGGVVDGSELAFAFSSLRANDLVWNYVAQNYLEGKKPAPFDLLFWNGDSTNLPGPWYCYYLRNTYFENNLVRPDKLSMCGVPLDLRCIDMPAFVFAAREDHIVPWKTAYLSAQHLRGDTAFVLGASGHIAGVVNPATKNKRSFWTSPQLAQNAGAWMQHAHETPGSWWPTWAQWLHARSGRMIGARTKLGSERFPPTEAAPGRYVREKHVD